MKTTTTTTTRTRTTTTTTMPYVFLLFLSSISSCSNALTVPMHSRLVPRNLHSNPSTSTSTSTTATAAISSSSSLRVRIMTLRNIYDDWRSDATVDQLPLDEDTVQNCLDEFIYSDFGKTMFGIHDAPGKFVCFTILLSYYHTL